LYFPISRIQVSGRPISFPAPRPLPISHTVTFFFLPFCQYPISPIPFCGVLLDPHSLNALSIPIGFLQCGGFLKSHPFTSTYLVPFRRPSHVSLLTHVIPTCLFPAPCPWANAENYTFLILVLFCVFYRSITDWLDFIR